MKQKSNFRLLVKQGMSGVLRFKVQFIIIIIMVFLSTFILSTSLIISSRLQKSYDKVVKPVKRFDYSTSTYVDVNTQFNKDENFDYTPLLDFIPNQNIKIEGLVNPNESILNFNWSDDTFLQKFLEIDKVKDILNKDVGSLWKEARDKKNINNYAQLGDFAYVANEANKTDTKDKLENQTQLVFYLTKTIFEDMQKANSNPEHYLNESNMQLEIKQNKDYINRLLANELQTISTAQKADFSKKTSKEEMQFFSYVSLTSISIVRWLQFIDYEIKSNESLINQPEITVYKFITNEAELNIKQDNPPAFSLQKHYDEEGIANLKTNPQVFGYEIKDSHGQILEGKSFIRTGLAKQFNPQFLTFKETNESGKYKINSTKSVIPPFALGMSNEEKGTSDITQQLRFHDNDSMEQAMNKAMNFRFEDVESWSNKDKQPDQREYDRGLNPFKVQNLGLFFNDKSRMFSSKDPNSTWHMTSESIQKGYYYPIANPLMPMYEYHLKTIGKISNLDITFRKELLTYDSKDKTTFRQVILNDDDNANINILSGRMPIDNNEILINQQYARYHKLKPHDYIQVGNARYRIAGIATDAYAYVPIADPLIPFPQPKISAIIWGSAPTLFRSITDTHESQRDTTFKVLYTNFIRNAKTDSQINEFKNRQYSNNKHLWENYDNLSTPKAKNNKQEAYVRQPLVSFEESIFRYSFVLLPMILNLYNAIGIILSGIVAIISFISIVITINKTIKANAKQIAILKALGTNPLKITCSYLAYPIILIGIVIPLGLIAGTSMQSAFVHLFQPYFSVQMYKFVVDPTSILASFFIFGTIILLVSILAAFFITRKPVLEIMTKQNQLKSTKLFNWIKANFFHKRGFSFRFSITLANAGRKNIALTTSVIAIGSLLMSISIAIPNVAIEMEKSYYKNANYSNTYTNKDPIINTPLSKPTIGFWEGQDPLDATNHDVSIELKNNKKQIVNVYDTPTNYNASSFDVSPIPQFVTNTKNQILTTYEYIAQDKESNLTTVLKQSSDQNDENLPESSLFKLVTEIFGNNFSNNIGDQFSIGNIEQILGLIINSYNDLTEDENPRPLTDAEKVEKYNLTVSNLTQAVPYIIKAVIGGDTEISQPGDKKDWKSQILEPIYTQTPAFVRAEVEKSTSRQTQFGIGYNVEHFIPGQESLATAIDVESNNTNFALTGLDQNQTAYSLNEKIKSIWMDDDKLNSLQQNQLDSKIIIPVIFNTQALAGYHKKIGNTIDGIKFDQNVLFIKKDDQSDIELPSGAWVYDDSDFVEAMNQIYNNPNVSSSIRQDGIQNSLANRTGFIKQNTNNNYLDPFSLDNNKFSFKTQIKDDKLVSNAYMFSNFTYDQNYQNIESTFIRPYYAYKNIKLFAPKKLIDKDIFFNEEGRELVDVNMNDKKWAEDWRTDNIKSDSVPKSVIEAWAKTSGLTEGELKSSEWMSVNPYDKRYGVLEDANLDNPGMDGLMGTNSLIWYRAANSRDGGGTKPISIKKVTRKFDNVQLEIVDELKTYNDRTILIDQRVANVLTGMPNARKIGIKDLTFGDEVIKAGTSGYDGSVSKFDRYTNMTNFHNDYLLTNDADKIMKLTYNHSKKVEDNPLYWHNKKFSNIEEALGLTSGVSYSASDNAGVNFIAVSDKGPSQLTFDGIALTMDSQTLLVTTKDMINQISTLAISIAMLLIVTVVITSVLTIIQITDIFISQYRAFMISMKSLGYSNLQIQLYTFTPVSILALTSWTLTTIGAWLLIYILIKALYFAGIALPFAVGIWPIGLSFLLMFISYFGSILIATRSLRKSEPAEAMKEESE